MSECLHARHSFQSINMFTVISATHFLRLLPTECRRERSIRKDISKQRLDRVDFHATIHLSPAVCLHCGKNRLLLHHSPLLLVFFNWKRHGVRLCLCKWINNSSSNRTNRFNSAVPLFKLLSLQFHTQKQLAASAHRERNSLFVCCFGYFAGAVRVTFLWYCYCQYDARDVEFVLEAGEHCEHVIAATANATLAFRPSSSSSSQLHTDAASTSRTEDEKEERTNELNGILRKDKIVYRALNINGNWSRIL